MFYSTLTSYFITMEYFVSYRMRLLLTGAGLMRSYKACGLIFAHMVLVTLEQHILIKSAKTIAISICVIKKAKTKDGIPT